MNKKFVSILPNRADTDVSYSTSSAGTNPFMQENILRKRRAMTSIACNDCRRKKIRCNGARPVCVACEGTTSECTYRDDHALSRDSQKLLIEAVYLLNSTTDERALKLLKQLKDETDASVILNTLRDLRGGKSPGMSSWSSSNSSSLPEYLAQAQRQQLGLELESHYPKAYQAFEAPTLETLQNDKHRHLAEPSHKHSSAGPSQIPFLLDSSLRQDKSKLAWPEVLCDPRLYDLDITQWTDVKIDSSVAAKAISLYLETDHPLLGFFNPDLFIEDLIHGKLAHCSSLLVNALLYWALQMYTGIDPDLDLSPLQFCSRAEELWETERFIDSTLTLSAAHFLSLGYLGQGRNHLVLSYLEQAVDIGRRMGLFTAGSNSTSTALLSADLRSELEYAAWGTFNWITLMTLFYRQPGSPSLPHPPNLPIPDRADDKQLKFMGGVFPHLCLFWRIMYEVSLAYKNDGGWDLDNTRAIYFAEFKFRELLAWSDGLPLHLRCGDHHSHYAQILHIWFHAGILDIFRPCMANDTQHRRLRTFSSSNCSLGEVYAISIRQLKHLVLNFRLNFASSSYTLLWHTALTYLSNAILFLPKDDSSNFYFLLCIYGYEQLGQSWRVTQAISTALLSMALRNGDLNSNTARAILKSIEEKTFPEVSGIVRGTFMADLNMAQFDPESASVDNQAKDFEENAHVEDLWNSITADGEKIVNDEDLEMALAQ